MNDLMDQHIKNLFRICRMQYCNSKFELTKNALTELRAGTPCLIIIQEDGEDTSHDKILLCKLKDKVKQLTSPNKFQRMLRVVAVNGVPCTIEKTFSLNVDESEGLALIGMKPSSVFMVPDSNSLLSKESE